MSPEYLLTVGIFTGIFIVLTVSLNILTGYAKQVSLGHAAFFGIGAYSQAILVTRFDFSFWSALPLTIILSALIGSLLGLPSLRVSHDFLVLTTIGLNFIMVAVFGYFDFFGGAMGIIGIPMPEIFGRTLTNLGYFLMVFGFVIIAILLSYFFSKTWARLAMEGLGEDELAAKSLGISVARFKIYAFMISSGLAGLAGSLWAHYLGSVFPNNFAFSRSISIISMLVFGGMGTIRGAVFGGFLLKVLPEMFRFIENYRMLIYGGILVLMVMFQPMGLLGRGSVLWKLYRRFSPSKSLFSNQSGDEVE